MAAPAKVNLWLRVGAPEADGFHPIDTLFCALHLADSVVLRHGAEADPDLKVGCASPLRRVPDLGPVEDNLAVRAARAFMDRAGLARGPEIRLVKRIPVGAGLGGGSSDAAAVLRGLSRLHPDTLALSELMEVAAELGSDVPFFLAGGPLAYGHGRGQRLTQLPPLPGRPVVVAIPPFAVATGQAYGWLDEDRAEAPPLPDAGEYPHQVDWPLIAERSANDFEASVFHRHPELVSLRNTLWDQGARVALLAGSGSTVFGVFEHLEKAEVAASTIQASDPEIRTVVTRTRMR